MTRAIVTILLGLTCATALPAHGGQYRGPGNQVPGVGGTGQSGSGPSSNGPGVPGPSTPGPGPSKPAPGPVAPAAGTQPTSTALGAPVGDDLTRWQYWWEWNKDPFLRLREVMREARSVVPGSDEHLLGPRRGMVTRGALRPTDKQILEQVMPALRDALTGSDQRDIVSSCLIAFAKIGCDHPDFAILPLMRQRLASADQEIRETAALAMGISRMPAAIPDLLALIRDDARGRELCGGGHVDERSRAFAAYGLGLVGKVASVADQRRCLDGLVAVIAEGGLRRDVRIAAIHALRLIEFRGHAEASDVLRDVAIRALWHEASREDRPSEQIVRAHALLAVASLVGRGGDRDDHYKSAIAGWLDDPKADPALTQAAALALGELCESPADFAADAKWIETLAHGSETTLDHQTRFFCLIALGRIGGDAARDRLLQTLAEGGKALVKPWAALALGVMGRRSGDADEMDRIGKALLPVLREVRNDQTRAAVAVALGLVRHRPAIDDLRTILRDETHLDELVGYSCIGLALMGADEARDDIRRVVLRASRRPELLRQAAVSLGRLGDGEANQMLLGDLEVEGNSLATLSAVGIALGLIGDRRSLEPLIELLGDEERPALSRAFAAVALGGIADDDDLPWGSALAEGINYRAAVDTLTDGVAGVLDIL